MRQFIKQKLLRRQHNRRKKTKKGKKRILGLIELKGTH
jgi:hypothetical protein